MNIVIFIKKRFKTLLNEYIMQKLNRFPLVNMYKVIILPKMNITIICDFFSTLF